MKHSDFYAWGSISRAVIWLSWVLGIFAFFGLFLHYKLVKIIFNDCGIKTNVIQTRRVHFFVLI